MAYKMLAVIFILIETIAIAQARNWTLIHEVIWRFGVLDEFAGGAQYTNQFKLGDQVVFKYPRGAHDVIEVDKNGFDNCMAPPSAKKLTSGEDWIKLNTIGQRWFICGIGQHCKEHGMKVMLEVKGPLYEDIFLVGNDQGWKRNFDYKAWAADHNKNIFDVGDKLVFIYEKGKHNVIQVDEAAYNQCTVPPNHEALTSGHDVVILTKPGGFWFISGIGDDCKKGMKLFINVKPPALKPGRKLIPEDPIN